MVYIMEMNKIEILQTRILKKLEEIDKVDDDLIYYTNASDRFEDGLYYVLRLIDQLEKKDE